MRSSLARRPGAARWRVTLLAAVALAALAGCASASATSTVTPTPTYRLGGKFATATAESWTPTLPPDSAAHLPIPGTPLSWVATRLPAGFGFAYHSSWLDVSNGNGATAYSCSELGNGPIQVIVTHDAGAAWSRVADLNRAWDGCMYIVVDALNPRIAVMTGGSPYSYALTTNGGQSWRTGTNPILTSLWSLATTGSRTYALSSDGGGGGSTVRLYVSVDGLASWRDGSPPMGGQTVVAFWANPANGGLLVETQQGSGGPTTLWRSSDGGASWTRNDLTEGIVSEMVASPLHGSATWVICQDAASGQNPTSHSCSTDNGVTWRALPELDDTGLYGYRLFGVTGDGAVLAVGDSDTDWRIYRLTPGAARWQTLGSAPLTTGFLRYTPAAGGDGLIWSLPSVQGGGSGDANPSDVLVAAYPY